MTSSGSTSHRLHALIRSYARGLSGPAAAAGRPAPAQSKRTSGKRGRGAANSPPPRRVYVGPLDLIKQARGLPESWREVLADELSKEYFIRLAYDVQVARSGAEVYPPAGQEFAALRLCTFADVKVVIVGQDPYHGAGQAHGLAFSVRPGVPVPPSLSNVYKELVRDDEVPFSSPQHGCLVSWARQGVLLLNSTLTVSKGRPNSHKALWQPFTDATVKLLSERKEGLVFLLWGRDAQEKCKGVDTRVHDVLTAPHPSPLSAHRGFLHCGHFGECNKLLRQRSIEPIRWQLPMSVAPADFTSDMRSSADDTCYESPARFRQGE